MIPEQREPKVQRAMTAPPDLKEPRAILGLKVLQDLPVQQVHPDRAFKAQPVLRAQLGLLEVAVVVLSDLPVLPVHPDLPVLPVAEPARPVLKGLLVCKVLPDRPVQLAAEPARPVLKGQLALKD